MESTENIDDEVLSSPIPHMSLGREIMLVRSTGAAWA